MTVVWCVISFFVGAVLGVVLMALAVAAGMSDRR